MVAVDAVGREGVAAWLNPPASAERTPEERVLREGLGLSA